MRTCFLGLILLLVASSCAGAQKNLRGGDLDPSKTRLGRFAFVVPSRMLMTSVKLSVHGINVSTEALAEKTPEAVFSSRLESLGEVSATRVFDNHVMAVTYREGSTDFLLAMKAYPTFVLWMSTSIRLARFDDAMRHVESVAARFTPHSRSGFCIGHGAFEEESFSERMRVVLQDPNPSAHSIIFETSVRRESTEPISIEMNDKVNFVRFFSIVTSLSFVLSLAGFGDELKRLEGFAVGVSTKCETVAGFHGTATRFEFGSKEGDRMESRLNWYVDGTIDDPNEPEILIEGKEAATEPPEGSRWSEFLGSIRQSRATGT